MSILTHTHARTHASTEHYTNKGTDIPQLMHSCSNGTNMSLVQHWFIHWVISLYHSSIDLHLCLFIGRNVIKPLGCLWTLGLMRMLHHGHLFSGDTEKRLMPRGNLRLRCSGEHLIMPLFAVELTLSPWSLAEGGDHLFTSRATCYNEFGLFIFAVLSTFT